MTYSFPEPLTSGTVVSVPLKTTLKEAVVITEVEQPEFETARIVSASDKYYSNEQMEIAKFISEYYFSSFGEAISLFLPYLVGVDPRVDPLDEIKVQISSSVQGRTRGSSPTGIAVLPKLSPSQQKAYTQLLKKDKAFLFGVSNVRFAYFSYGSLATSGHSV